ncbi:hypothetical protein NQ318_007090 [Aromia moschata]|uniref:Uncharacterized protein n=1 Tax=Aromia moschata TaxID=1265417 RepID=A0AAV8XDF6_9CUCU|nr:hypothetical protein NQ318_007090 [Aromia moschata]
MSINNNNKIKDELNNHCSVDVKSESDSNESNNVENENVDDSSVIEGKEKKIIKKLKRKKSQITKNHNVSSKQDITCAFCNSTFESYMDYKIHRKKEADRRRKKHPCPICQKLISTYKLKDHINSHTKERPYQCEVCGEKKP